MASRRPRGKGSDPGDPTGDDPRPDPSPPVAGDDPDAEPIEDDAVDPSSTEDDAEDEAVPSGGRRRSVLDARTVAICTLIALIAALATGLLVSRLTDDDDAEAPAVGSLTPAEEAPEEVALTRFDGSETDLGDYRGQPLVVNFWSTTCQPCVQEMPDLEAVNASLDGEVTFLGVNTQDTPEAAQALAERTGVTYDLVQDVEGELSRALGVATLPVTVLVLPDGTVIDTIHRQVSSERLCEKINQSLLGGSLEECG